MQFAMLCHQHKATSSDQTLSIDCQFNKNKKHCSYGGPFTPKQGGIERVVLYCCMDETMPSIVVFFVILSSMWVYIIK